MNPKIEKLEKEIEKTKTKIAEMQAKLHKLEELSLIHISEPTRRS